MSRWHDDECVWAYLEHLAGDVEIAGAGLEQAALEETRRQPHRFDHLKLAPHSAWEFTRWNAVDTIGFAVSCAVTLAIILMFWGLLRLAGT